MSDDLDNMSQGEIDRLYAQMRSQAGEDHLTQGDLDEVLERGDNMDEEKVHLQFQSDSSTKQLVLKIGSLLKENTEMRRGIHDEMTQEEADALVEQEELLYEFLRTNVLPLSAFKETESMTRFVDQGGVRALVEVLDHPNNDISVKCAVQLLKELTDEDIEPAVSEKVCSQVLDSNALVFFLHQLNALSFDLSNVKRAEESRDGSEIILGLMENLLDLSPRAVADKILHNDNFAEHFLVRLKELNNPQALEDFEEVFSKHAEILSVAIQSSSPELKSKFVLTLNGFEAILQILNAYRQSLAIRTEEHLEATTCLFATLNSLTLVFENVEQFCKVQGPQLLFSLFKKQKHLRRLILETLAGLVQNSETGDICSPALAEVAKSIIEDCNGLPALFGFFMLDFEEEEKKFKRKAAKDSSLLFVRLSDEDHERTEKHLFQVLLGLWLNSSGVEKDRLIFKFGESEFGKLEKLIGKHDQLYGKLSKEFSLAEFNSSEEVEYLRAEFRQLDTVFVVALLLASLAESREAAAICENGSTHSFKERIGQRRMNELLQVLKLQKLEVGELEANGAEASQNGEVATRSLGQVLSTFV